MKNYYQVLGLEEEATIEDIKTAYKEYVVKFHPDKHNGDEFFKARFQEIQEAYEYLIKKRDTSYIEEPTIMNFNISSDEIIVGDKVIVSWEIKNVYNITLLVKTTNGIDKYSNLPSKGEMAIAPQSQDMNVGLSIIANNNIAEIASNKLIHLRNPPNQFEDSIGFKLIWWGIVVIGIIGIISIIFSNL